MTNIKPIAKYPCPVSGKLFDSLEEAQNNAAKESVKRQREKAKAVKEKASAKKREQIRNSIRLEAESMKDIEEMLNSQAKLLFPNERIPEVIISDVSTSHYYHQYPKEVKILPQISFTLNFKCSDGNHDRVCKLIETDFNNCGFYGFHSGSGSGGRKYSRINIEDFPKMWVKYREMVKLENDSRQNTSKERESSDKAYQKVIENSEYKSLAAKIQDLQTELQELCGTLKKKYYKAPKLKDVSRLEELRAAFKI